MMTTQSKRVLALPLLAALAASLPAVVQPRPQRFSPQETALLHASFDPALGSLRGGGVDWPAVLSMSERTELGAAQACSLSLEQLRGGHGISHQELGWVALGAGIVLLIVLLA